MMNGSTTGQVAPPATALALPAEFGRYRLIELIAVGGMSQIYLAHSFGAAGFVKRLAIKRMSPWLSAQDYFNRLFINEAKLLVSLNHSNIVSVFDFGQVGDELFIAMEYVTGPSLHLLREALRPRGLTLPWSVAAHIAAEACRGLDYAHRKRDPSGRSAGIVHRDIKPKNVLISSEGEVKLADFGVARLAAHQGDRRLVGTLAYMAPEQVARQPVDRRTDVFGVGLLLYEMLAARRAYRGSTQAVLAQASTARIPPLPSDVPGDLRRIVERATSADPNARYPDAHSMERALAAYLLTDQGEQDTAQALPPATRLSGLIRRLELAQETDLQLDPGSPALSAKRTAALAAPERTHVDESEIDFELLRDAGRTLHEAELTRVLVDSVRRRRILSLILLLTVAGLAALAAVRWWPAVTSDRRSATDADAGDDLAGLDPRPMPSTTRLSPLDSGRDTRAETPTLDSSAPRVNPPTKRPRRFGLVSLNTIPWSRVSIDGKRYGTTPLLRLRLTAGPHRVVLENPQRGLKKTLWLRVRAGQHQREIIKLR